MTGGEDARQRDVDGARIGGVARGRSMGDGGIGHRWRCNVRMEE